MPIKFDPCYTITPKVVGCLLRIEAVKEKVIHFPLTPTVLMSLRETARLHTTHYSTMIEGNNLTPDQIEAVVKHAGHFPGREREEHEVKGYYAAFNQVEQWVNQHAKITTKIIQIIHALVMGEGRTKIKPSSYRDGQNVIRDGITKAIVYMPPEANDVESLMNSLIAWINYTDLPCPLVAAITHYQLATIHPYYDGNGRTARLLTTLILHLGGYDLKGLYSLEEYYARNLGAYYEALTIGDSHNYYMGRAEADITKWIEYYVEGMAFSFESVHARMREAYEQGASDLSSILRTLDLKQRKVLALFQHYEFVTSRQMGELFTYKSRTMANLCATWTHQGFLKIVDSSNKGRKYTLGKRYLHLIKPIIT